MSDMSDVTLPQAAVSRSGKGFRGFELNPILDRELKARSRRAMGVITLTLFLLLLISIAAIVWGVNREVGVNFNVQEQANSAVGAQIFEGIISAMGFMVAFIVPALTASSIAGERDRQTLIPLQVSLLRPRQIVLGKLSAALAFTLLLILASAPILGVSYVIGGITALAILQGLVAVVVVAVLFGSIGMACSAIPKRSAGATVLAYGLTVFIVFLAPAAAALLGLVVGSTTAFFVGYAHPYAFLSDFTFAGATESDSVGPMSALAEEIRTSYIPAWGLQLFFYAFVCFGCLWLAARRLRTPAETER
jgi:ABC-type transport system involved in multi-copper enzyme maturation permease subunit